MTAYTARAHTNIALLKYWGKADAQLILPTTTSISLTLNEFYTDTTVEFDTQLLHDQIILNGRVLKAHERKKIEHFLDLVRQLAGIKTYARMVSINHVPTAAGLASSASAFAALAGAASAAAHLSLDPRDLSRLARQGSGSASRSIFGGFVQWNRGTDSNSSVAHALQDHVTWPIQLITVIVSDQPKAVDSRSGMQNARANSPYYQAWVQHTNAGVPAMQAAIANHDLDTLGRLAEQNALEMHAQNMVANPPFNYLTDTSWGLIKMVQNLREQGLSVYATMDAGPNVKIISQPQDTATIMTQLQQTFPDLKTQIATPGPGIQIWEEV